MPLCYYWLMIFVDVEKADDRASREEVWFRSRRESREGMQGIYKSVRQ